MVLARAEFDVTDDSGNLIVDTTSVEVRKESDGTLASLFSDRAGAMGIANPFDVTGGTVGFHVAGGAFKIALTSGAYTRTRRYVAIGLGAETDAMVPPGGTTGQALTKASDDDYDMDWSDPSANVNGPSSATDGHVATYDGATGKLIKDGGKALSSLASLSTTGQAFTGGVIPTDVSHSTVSSGTLTLDMGTGPSQAYTNGGAHTLAPGTNHGSMLLDITNNGSAGAITTSGFTKVTGSFDTTNAHKFRCAVSVGAAGSLLQIQAMQ